MTPKEQQDFGDLVAKITKQSMDRMAETHVLVEIMADLICEVD